MKKNPGTNSTGKMIDSPGADIGGVLLSHIRSVMMNSDVRIAYLDRKFTYIWVSPSYGTDIGYSASEIIGKKHFDLFPNPEYQRLLQQVIDSGQKGTLKDAFFQPPSIDKTDAYWDVTAIPVIDNDKRVIGVGLTVLETTERWNYEKRLERAAREWRQTFDSVPDLIFILDTNYRIIRANQAFATAVNMELEEVIGRTCYELIHHTSELWPLCPLHKLDMSKSSCSAEFFAPTLNRQLDVTVSPLIDTDSDHQLIGYVHVARDVTKRKVAEDKLLESEKKYRQLIENMREGVWVIDKNNYTSYVNPSMAAMLGYTVAEMLNKPVVSGNNKTRMRKVREHLERRAQGVSERYETEFVRKDGSIIYASLNAIPRLDEQGEYQGAFAVVEDVTQTRKAEQSLRESETRYRIVTENMEGGVVIFENGHAVYINAKATVITGYSKEDLLKMDVLKLIVPNDRQRFVERFRERTKYGTVAARMNTWIMDKGQKQRYIHINYCPINEENQPDRSFVIFHDITEMKKADTKLQAAYQNELQLHEQLENEIKKRTQFTHGLVHELKTPLTSVMTSSEILSREIKGGVTSKLASNIYNGAVDLDRRIDELLELAKIEVGSLKINIYPVDLLKLVRDTVTFIEVQATRKRQSLTCHLPRRLPTVYADGDRLRQVLLNLVGNAIRHTPPRSEISLHVKQDGSTVRIEVQDNGPGIASDKQQHLFDPYFRIESNPDHIGGLGMGLYISKNIIELHGGQMWLKSELGEGTVFGFSLPLAQGHAE